MRLIATLQSRDEADRLSYFLARKGIDNLLEIKDDQFEVWVENEDQLEEAEVALAEFHKGVRMVPPPEDEPKRPKRRMLMPGATKFGWITMALIAAAIVLFFFSKIEVVNGQPVFTGVYAALMFDCPTPPVWTGLYQMALGHGVDAPTFVAISQGEVWRLWTPVLLHGGFLHILFNVLWMLVLSNQVEERIGRFKFLIFVLLVGIISNVGQYLMTGPYFFGLSGIVCGLFGFIWMRQKVAPWEGYQLNKMTTTFILVFLLAMLALQVVQFVFEIMGRPLFNLMIANTAHFVAIGVGLILGRLKWFEVSS